MDNNSSKNSSKIPEPVKTGDWNNWRVRGSSSGIRVEV